MERRLTFSEVSDAQREELLRLFETADRGGYEQALSALEFDVNFVRSIEPHEMKAPQSWAATR